MALHILYKKYWIQQFKSKNRIAEQLGSQLLLTTRTMETTRQIPTIGKLMKLIPSFALTATLLLAGCANTTSVQLASSGKSEFDGAVYSGQVVNIEAQVTGVEKYRVFQQGATGFVSVQNVRADVEETANGFCKRKGKAMHAVTETASKPPHILGNFPRVELIFQCIEHQISKETIGENGKYEKLAILKKLLDSGTLTQQEFEVEKTKVLATP